MNNLRNTDITVSLSITKMPSMNKFLLIYHGDEIPTSEAREAWNGWFRRRAGSFADVGEAFGPGRRTTHEATIEFSRSANPASGYSIVNAKHIDAAEQLLEGCPIVDSVSLYPLVHINSEEIE